MTNASTISQRCLVVTLVVTALLTVSLPVEAQISGYFQLSQGKYLLTSAPPRGFEDFIAVNILSVRKKARPVVTGNVQADVNRAMKRAYERSHHPRHVPPLTYYRFTQVTLSGDQLSFTTAAIKGISYRFAGQLAKVKWNDVYERRAPVLEGTLVQLQNGQKIAEANVQMLYEENYE